MRLPGTWIFLANGFIGTSTSQRAKGQPQKKMLHLIGDHS